MLGSRALGSVSTSRRNFVVGAMSAAGLLGMAACNLGSSKSSTSGTTAKMMSNHSADWADQLSTVIKDFMAKTPESKVELLNVADGELYYTKLKTQALAKKLPDIYYLRTMELASHAKSGWVRALNDRIDQDKAEVNPEDYWPAVTAQITNNDKIYGLPEDLSSYGIFINKTMFAKAGIPVPSGDWTWDDYYALAAEFKETKGSRQTRWGGFVSGSSWGLRGVLKSNGGDMFSEDLEKCVINNDANVATFKTIAAAVKSGAIPGPESLPTGVDPFAGGLIAMQMNGSWYMNAARTAVADKFEWDVVKLPKGSTGKREICTAGGTWCMSRDAESPDVAWSFLKYLTSPDVQTNIPYLQGAGLPARQQVSVEWTKRNEASPQPPASIEIFKSQIEDDAGNLPYPANWSEFEVSWGNRIPSLMNGGDPKEILQKIQDESNK